MDKERRGNLLLVIFALVAVLPLLAAGVVLLLATIATRTPVRYVVPVPGPPHRRHNRRYAGKMIDFDVAGPIGANPRPWPGALNHYVNRAKSRWKEAAASRKLALGCSFRA